jgi:hypothetical protein
VAAIDDPLSIKWRVEVGKAVAALMELPGKHSTRLESQAFPYFMSLVGRRTGLRSQRLAPRVPDV